MNKKGEDVMIGRRLKNQWGLTLPEILAAAAIMTIVMLAIITCRYHSALDVRRANMQMTATRLGLTLCESWRGVHGDETYDPSNHLGADLKITGGAGPKGPTGFTSLGSYAVASNNATYYVTLSWQDVNPGLRALNVIVAWPQQVKPVAKLNDADKLFELTTYTIN